MGIKSVIVIGVSALALLTVGCGDAQARAVEKETRLAALHAEGEALKESIADVEARLHVNRARAAVYQELGARHRNVSALACEVADSHMLSMVKHVEKNTKKSKQARMRRVANADSDSIGGTTGGGR